MEAKLNDTVKVHYKGTLSNGEVFDTSEGKEPLEFKLGEGKIIPGLEKGIVGMQAEESKEITVAATEAFGEKREDLIQEVPKSQLPKEIEPEVGLKLMSQSSEGKEIPLTVTEVKEESITVDANHPLAGEDLTFAVTLVSVQ